jgi:hypothetical protein
MPRSRRSSSGLDRQPAPQISLPGHAPYRGSDTYYFERWRVMKPAEIEAWTRDVGRPPACETCRSDEREAARAKEQP